MAWSSFAHLPAGEEEYIAILSKLQDEMTTKEVDDCIALVKGKEKISHHYRNNLVNIGIIEIKDKKVHLNYSPGMLLNVEGYLPKVLREAVLNGDKPEISKVSMLICKNHTYDLVCIANSLRDENPALTLDNCKRWIRPIVALIKIIGPIENQLDQNVECLQNAYLKLAKDFGKNIAIERIANELVKAGCQEKIETVITSIIKKPEYRFRIELLMMPYWATTKKAYTISNDIFTHIKLKGELR